MTKREILRFLRHVYPVSYAAILISWIIPVSGNPIQFALGPCSRLLVVRIEKSHGGNLRIFPRRYHTTEVRLGVEYRAYDSRHLTICDTADWTAIEDATRVGFFEDQNHGVVSVGSGHKNSAALANIVQKSV